MLEEDQLIDGCRGKFLQAGSVELLAGNLKHQITGVNQRDKDYNSPFGLQTIPLVWCEVLNAVNILDQFRAIDYLAVPFFLRISRMCLAYLEL